MATALHPQQYVPGPARVPIKFGLFSVLDFRGTPDTNWEGGGERWQSFNGTPELGIIGPTQQLESDILGNTLSFTPSTDIDTAGVFTVYGQDRVTPGPGWSGDQAKQRARDFLAALEERAAEMALAGVVAGLTPNMSTAPSAGSSIDLIQVIALLEGYLADHYGSLGVIHMSRSNALLAVSRDNVLIAQGNALFTKLGTPVVAGQGYADTVAYCTSALLGYRSEVFESTGRPYDLLNKNTNDLYAIAERTYSIGFESAALAAVTIGTPAT
jgi:hypothetical protein